jgi:hypothetical protein
MVARAGLLRAHAGVVAAVVEVLVWANFSAEFRMGSPMTDDRKTLPCIDTAVIQ